MQLFFFSSHFGFLHIFVLLTLVLFVLFVVAVISLFFFLGSFLWSRFLWRRFIDVSTLSSMLASPLFPSFLNTSNSSISSLECKGLCIVMSFLVLWSICWSSSLVHFKNGPEDLTLGTTQVFISLMRLQLESWVFSSFLVLLRNFL